MSAKRVVRIAFGLILLVAFAFCSYMSFVAAPKSLELNKTPVESAAPVETPAPSAAPEESPAVSQEPVESEVPEETPEPVNSDLPQIDITSWEYILANLDNPIGEYTPTTETLEGQPLDARIIEPMKEFVAAARAEGLSVYLSSGYRDYATQQYLYNRKVAQYGEEVAKTIVAPPGTSEHQTGLACDITDRYYESKDRSLENTAMYQWMSQHCQEYGFIVRYPDGKEDVTGIIYEPWHFRYVGVEAATYIMEHGLCLEEFLDLYK